jgi:hypothetical protein
LVWADRVGGERGELVAVQCALARAARGEVRAELDLVGLRARERELLTAHAVAWAGPLAARGRGWSFRRGFLEAAWVDDLDGATAALEAHPLLSSITIGRWPASVAEAHRAPLARFRAVAIDVPPAAADRAARLERDVARAVGAQLRARAVGLWVASEADEELAVHALLYVRPARARISGPRLPASQVMEVLGSPGLSATLAELELACESPSEVAARIARRPLRALRLGAHMGPGGAIGGGPLTAAAWAALSRGRAGDMLEHLDVELGEDAARAPEVSFPLLRSLRLRGQPPSAAVLAKWRLPRLRQLHLAIAPAPGEAHQLRLQLGSGLELEGVAPPGALAPPRGGEPAELLTDGPLGLRELGEPWPRRAPPIAIAGAGARWCFAGIRAGARVVIGRAPGCELQLASALVGRRHAALAWEAGRWTVAHLGTSPGAIEVNGTARDLAELADGDTIRVGDHRLRCFLGVDAEARCAAALGIAPPA